MTRTHLDNQPPVSLAELKSHILMTSSDFDTVLTVDLLAAIAATENYTGMIVWRSACVVTDGYCRSVRLPVYNVRSITSVKLDSVTIPATDYEFNDNCVTLKGVHLSFLKIEVMFEAGYAASPNDVPDDLRAAILMQAAAIFANPDDPVRQLPTASQKLMEPYRHLNV